MSKPLLIREDLRLTVEADWLHWTLECMEDM